MSKLFLLFIYLVLSFISNAQNVSGTITDEKGEQLPFVTVFVKEIKFGTSSNKDGKYSLTLTEGKYTVVFQCLGYATIEKQVLAGKKPIILNIQLPLKPYQLSTVNVSSNTEDKAYAIMRKAIGMASYYRNQVKEFNSEVYMKGTVKVNKLSWAVKFATRNEKDAPKEGTMYFQESLNNIHYKAPNTYDQNVKMIRSNFPEKDSGNENVMEFVNASLYQAKIGDIILPLAPYAFKHYKFRYAGFTKEGDRIVNKIRVIPKRKSKQLVEGYIYIADTYWNLHSADLEAETVIGKIQVKQTFGEVEKNVWLPVSYNFVVYGKFLGNEGTVNYISSVKYKSIVVNSGNKILSNTILGGQDDDESVSNTKTPSSDTKKKLQKQLKKEQKRKEQIEELLKKEDLSNKEMYTLSKLMDKDAEKSSDTVKIKSLEIKRSHNITIDSTAKIADSAIWNVIRPVALTNEEEQGMVNMHKDIARRDSMNKKLDSLKNLNKWYTIIFFGKNWYNVKKKRQINFSGIITPDQFRFNTVDGFVTGIDFYFRKTFEKNDIRLNPILAYAINRKELMGKLTGRFSYAPFRRGIAGISVGSESTDYNRKNGISAFGNTISSLFFRTNYMKLYEHQFCELYNQIDIVNGLDLKTGISYYNRTMLKNYSDYSFFFSEQKDYTLNFPINDTLYGESLNDHQALIGTVLINYTPEYYYYIYKNRKIMSSSKYPTFSIEAKFAVTDVVGDANFCQLEARVKQNISVGPSSRLSYNLTYGDFLLKSKIFFPDYKHFNTQEIPVVFGDFSNSFQFLKYYQYSTNSSYMQAFIGYQSPYLAIKFLPWFSNRLWVENLYLSALYTQKLKPYWEVGYAMTQIGLLGAVGVFVGFDQFEFRMIGAKASITFGGEVRF